jgi:hypothetical protein
MSQSGLIDPARETDWDHWYLEHLRIMVSVSGVDSAQRFKTQSHGCSPSLAMYSVTSPDVFQDPYYLSVRGMGEFLPLIDRRWYQRNLFAGLERAPAVIHGQALLLFDATKPAAYPGVEFHWLEAAALDKSHAVSGDRSGRCGAHRRDSGALRYRLLLAGQRGVSQDRGRRVVRTGVTPNARRFSPAAGGAVRERMIRCGADMQPIGVVTGRRARPSGGSP